MTEEERSIALKIIQNTIPSTIFDRFCVVLGSVSEHNDNHDNIIRVLSQICTHKRTGFTYKMDSKDTAETITPIREIIDLLDGWLIAAHIESTTPRIAWAVEAIVEEVKK